MAPSQPFRPLPQPTSIATHSALAANLRSAAATAGRLVSTKATHGSKTWLYRAILPSSGGGQSHDGGLLYSALHSVQAGAAWLHSNPASRVPQLTALPRGASEALQVRGQGPATEDQDGSQDHGD